MEKKASLLSLLEKRAEKGITTKEIAKKFGYTKFGSASKIIYLLRRDGHKIDLDNETGCYVLVEKKVSKEKATKPVTATTEEVSSEESGSEETGTEVTGSEETDSEQIEQKQPLTKKYLILKTLTENGSKGASVNDLENLHGIKKGTVCYHIHSLRNKDKMKIVNTNGRYYLKSKNVSIPEGKTSKVSFESEEKSETEKLFDIIKDRELIDGIKKVDPEDIDSYLDLVKKAAYFKQCALNLVNTSRIISGIKSESLSL